MNCRICFRRSVPDSPAFLHKAAAHAKAARRDVFEPPLGQLVADGDEDSAHGCAFS